MKISVITPNYNGARYLEQTIQSVLSQKGNFELEYIVMDGGSTDGSLEILKRHKEEISYTSEKDKGQSDALNKGLKKATGDIIAWINADDFYEPGTFQKVTEYFAKNPDCMWLTGYCKIVNEKDKEVRKYVTAYKNNKLKHFNLNDSLIVENCISQPSTFFRREILDAVGYIDETLHYSMDQDYWCRIAKKYELKLVPECLANFRFTKDTKTGGNIGKQLKESEEIAKRYTNDKKVLFKVKLNNLKRLVLYKYISKILKQ
jgi:glycosyltransferase involved in cell wall biosynthesis